jgi:hypothetical protein
VFKELGLKFTVTGFSEAANQLRELANAHNQMTNTVSSQSSKIGGHMESISSHTKRMATAVSSNLKIAMAAFAAFAAGKGLAGIGHWMGGSSDVGHAEDFLRQMGAGEDRIKAFRGVSNELSKKIAGFNKADFMRGMYNVQSLHAEEGMSQMTDVGRTMGFLSKKLDATVNEASDFYKVMYESFGKRLPEAQKKAFHGDVLAGVSGLLERTGIKPEELKQGMRQLGGVYATEGKGWLDALTDMAMVVPSQGPERGATALRNIAGRKGEMFAKLDEAVQKIRYEKELGQKFRDMTEEQQQLFMKGKGWNEDRAKEEGSMLERANPAAFWRKLSSHIEKIKSAGGDWMGKLKEALGEETFSAVTTLAGAWKSGYREKTAKELKANLDPAGTEKAILDSQKSFAAQYDIFEQNMSSLSNKARQFLAPAVTEIFKSWNSSIDQVALALEGSMDSAAPKMKGMLDSFKTAFAGAFDSKGGVGIDSWMTSMLSYLQQGEEGWRKIGAEVGNFVGTHLKSVVDAMKGLGQLITSINGLMDKFGFGAKKEGDGAAPVDVAKSGNKSNWFTGALAGFLKTRSLGGTVLGGLFGNTEIGSTPLAGGLMGAVSGGLMGIPLGPWGIGAGIIGGGILGSGWDPLQGAGKNFSNVTDVMYGVDEGPAPTSSSLSVTDIISSLVDKINSLVPGNITVDVKVEGDTSVIKDVVAEAKSDSWSNSLADWY